MLRRVYRRNVFTVAAMFSIGIPILSAFLSFLMIVLCHVGVSGPYDYRRQEDTSLFHHPCCLHSLKKSALFLLLLFLNKRRGWEPAE